MALELACFTAAAPNGDGVLRIYSENLRESREFPVSDLGSAKPRKEWSDYVIGVAQQLIIAGVPVAATNLAIHSTVPVGSGLSSSAAIEVSTAYALLAGRPMDKTQIAKLCQRAEREFVGMPCGIMDQYVSVHGAPHSAVLIDCRSITHDLVSLPENVSIIAVNSMVKHELGGSAYRDRVRECAEAVAVIQQQHPQVASLRDVKSKDLESFRNSMPEVPFRRARHVTTEDERVTAFKRASDAGDLEIMGKLFVASHRSLQHDYEVSCEELDYLVDTAVALSGVYGARMTGGGFGGCTVNLVKPEAADQFVERIRAEYKKKYNLDPTIIPCVPAAGAGPVS
jgi:galactokinase